MIAGCINQEKVSWKSMTRYCTGHPQSPGQKLLGTRRDIRKLLELDEDCAFFRKKEEQAVFRRSRYYFLKEARTGNSANCTDNVT